MKDRPEPIGGVAGAAGEALFHAAVSFRNALYDRRILPVRRLPLPVISVGNLSAGGTGKTPVAMELIRLLRAKGRRPALLSRGYGRRHPRRPVELPRNRAIAEGDDLLYGDEPCLYRLRFPDLPILLDRDRIRAGRLAAARGDGDALLLDDGMQHRRLHRDLEIVLLPGRDPFRGGRLLPRGVLRERPEAIRRADLVLVNVDRGEDGDLAGVLDQAGAPPERILFRLEPDRLAGPEGEELPPEFLRERAVLAVSGIGEPGRFHRTLERAGARLAGTIDLPDHHRFSAADYATIGEEADRTGALPVVTGKDRTRIGGKEAARRRIHTLHVRARFAGGGEERISAVLDALFHREET